MEGCAAYLPRWLRALRNATQTSHHRSLRDAWEPLYEGVIQPWLVEGLGRPADEHHTSRRSPSSSSGTSVLPTLTLRRTLTEAAAAAEATTAGLVARGTVLVERGRRWQALMFAATVFYGTGRGLPDASRARVLPPSSTRPADAADHERAQLTAVAGPVHLLYDDPSSGPVLVRRDPLNDAKHPVVLLVSISGINLAYGAADRARFLRGGGAPPGLRDDDDDDETAVDARIRAIAATAFDAHDDPFARVPSTLAVLRDDGRRARLPRLDAGAYVAAMARTWYVALEAMRRCGVRYAVLNAIGCGAFRGPFAEVPFLVAVALRRVLRSRRYAAVRSLLLRADARETAGGNDGPSLPNGGRGEAEPPPFDAIIVCFPGVDANDDWNCARFRDAFWGSEDPDDRRRVALFERHRHAPPPPVSGWLRPWTTGIGLRCRLGLWGGMHGPSMMHVAGALAERGCSVGMLNPSDVMAVRGGHIGMYFDGGHIALEELLAVGTTALTMNRRLHPELWSDDNRWVPVEIDDDLV